MTLCLFGVYNYMQFTIFPCFGFCFDMFLVVAKQLCISTNTVESM